MTPFDFKRPIVKSQARFLVGTVTIPGGFIRMKLMRVVVVVALKLDLPSTATRAELLAAMEGHVVGKAAYVGRFRTP
jgi:hypothetical protein